MNTPGDVPSRIVKWKATHKDGRVATFPAMRWFDAREQAMRYFECGQRDVEVEIAE